MGWDALRRVLGTILNPGGSEMAEKANRYAMKNMARPEGFRTPDPLLRRHGGLVSAGPRETGLPERLTLPIKITSTLVIGRSLRVQAQPAINPPKCPMPSLP